MYEPSKLPELSPQPVERELVIEPWRKVLLDAAEYIRVHGHCKGNAFGHGQSACIIGALSRAQRNYAIRKDAEDRFSDYQWARGLSVVVWNDDPSRTKEDVISALTECAGQP